MGNVFEVLGSKQMEDRCKLTPSRLVIELNNNEKEHWIVHLHYRNLRTELTVKEFFEYADTVTEAKRKLSTLSA